MRRIDFRAWDKVGNRMYNPHINNTYMGLKVEPYSDLMQYTGLKDKNGKEIFEGDIVELTPGTTDKKCRWQGVISRIDTFNPSCPNLYFMGTRINFKGDFKYGIEEVDEGNWYGYSSRDDLSFRRDGEFEVIGNIYENPDLLKV